MLFVLCSIILALYEKTKPSPQVVVPEQNIDIVLSPHYDDAALSLGGMLDDHTNQKMIVTFFTSDIRKVRHTEWDRASGFIDSLELVKARKKENVQALMHFKDIHIIDYQYSDFQYDERTATSSQSLKDSITKNILDLIAQHPGDIVNVYGPSYFGAKITHPDHNILHEAFIAATKLMHDSKVTFYFYEDFPYVDRFNKEFAGLDFGTYLATHDNTELQRQPLFLTERNIETKKAALHDYSSQMRALSHGLHSDISQLDSTFNRIRCANDLPQAYGCEVVYKLIR